MSGNTPPLQAPVTGAWDMAEGAAAVASQTYQFRLYTAGPTSKSAQAVVNIRKLCEEHLKGLYELEVVDLLDDPARALADQIVAAPTLVKAHPLPVRKFIGDLSQTERLLQGLDLKPLERP